HLFLAAVRPPEQRAARGSNVFLRAVTPDQHPAAATAPADAAAGAIAYAGTPTAYPGDTASQDQIAAWMAGEAQARGLPGELPVMASLVESGMHNLTG